MSAFIKRVLSKLEVDQNKAEEKVLEKLQLAWAKGFPSISDFQGPLSRSQKMLVTNLCLSRHAHGETVLSSVRVPMPAT